MRPVTPEDGNSHRPRALPQRESLGYDDSLYLEPDDSANYQSESSFSF